MLHRGGREGGSEVAPKGAVSHPSLSLPLLPLLLRSIISQDNNTNVLEAKKEGPFPMCSMSHFLSLFSVGKRGEDVIFPFLLLRSGWLRRTFSRVSILEDEYEKEMELLFHHSQSRNFPSFLIRIFLPIAGDKRLRGTEEEGLFSVCCLFSQKYDAGFCPPQNPFAYASNVKPMEKNAVESRRNGWERRGVPSQALFLRSCSFSPKTIFPPPSPSPLSLPYVYGVC